MSTGSQHASEDGSRSLMARSSRLAGVSMARSLLIHTDVSTIVIKSILNIELDQVGSAHFGDLLET